MKNIRSNFELNSIKYIERLKACLTDQLIADTESLAYLLKEAWEKGKYVYICGNGGSAANAIHIANDMHYGAGACGREPSIPGLKVEALPANTAIITCLANDTGYENIYANQILNKGRENDLLIVLSGSGNSHNIIKALKAAQKIGMKSIAILAFDGGHAKKIADNVIHVETYDMQVAEDLQLIIGHMCMQWLSNNKPHTRA